MASTAPQERADTFGQEGEFISSSTRYDSKPEWKDVTPIYNSIAEDAVVRISHTPEFIDAFAYFRAVLHKNEMSERAFELTTTCSQLNPANYSVWQFRRNLLRALKKDLNQEMTFCKDMACEHPKNYQIWHHRRVLVEWSNDPSKELPFTDYVLIGDNKNYHAWQHRQWVVERFNLFDQREVEYSLKLLEEDMRNNSAWNYRYFIVNSLSNQLTNMAMIDKELELIEEVIQEASANESAWTYLAGILGPSGIAGNQRALNFCQKLHDAGNHKSPHLCYILFDYHYNQAEKGENTNENVTKATELLEELANVDMVRHKYIDYLKNRLQCLQEAQK
ncbi:unnamed protein product [Bursaphelenchus okinawaensis]|uniref:Protein farnesyltransferase/geranylgeranyltransferase type-1 subunit alpha n=1 Tax=Bursaphelenchus okinawaensis TaxID=465554 RepID=A0A811L301_9BILA|nr:unnamed protein product [Bursaphelenchus okinawaensis]CAG9115411.1 unnamed protein product [Bursaphelenchus okinawaensis]